MDEQKLRDEIRKLISRNKTEDAFELLSSIQFSKEDKQLIVLNSQYNRIKEELRLNIISKDEGERRINQINMALLDISNKMDSSKPTFSDYKSIPPQKQSFNPKFLLLFLIPLTAFLVYWGMSSNDGQAKKSDESTLSIVNEIEAGDDANRATKETVTPQEKDDNNSNGDTQAKPIDNAKESTVNPDTQKPDPAEIKLEKSWTEIDLYQIQEKTYAIGYNSKSGKYNLYEIESNGKPIKQLKSDKWNPGWTSIDIYHVQGKAFGIWYNEATGAYSIYDMKSNGEPGKQLKSDKWNPGWTSIDIYNVQGKAFGIWYNKTTGAYSIYDMKSNGESGKKLKSDKWNPGWTSIDIYQIQGKAFGIWYNETTGAYSIYDIKSNGEPGKQLKSDKWNPGWTSIDIYNVQGKAFGIWYNKTTGAYSIYDMKSNGESGKKL